MNLWHAMTPWNNVPFLELPEFVINHTVVYAIRREFIKGDTFYICRICTKLEEELKIALPEVIPLFSQFRHAIQLSLGSSTSVMEGIIDQTFYTVLTPEERRNWRLAWLDNLLLPANKRKTYWRRSK